MLIYSVKLAVSVQNEIRKVRPPPFWVSLSANLELSQLNSAAVVEGAGESMKRGSTDGGKSKAVS